jgi:hypothetical protein
LRAFRPEIGEELVRVLRSIAGLRPNSSDNTASTVNLQEIIYQA